MAAALTSAQIGPEILRFILLAYGLGNAYRIISLDEIIQALPHVRKDLVRSGLDDLASEGLVTKFAGRYCFNKQISTELRHTIERAVSSSGTLRQRR